MRFKFEMGTIEGALAKKLAANAMISSIIRKNGAQMQEKAMRFAPVDTGHLKRSITLQVTNKKAEVESTADYAIYQEYGTRYQPGTPHIRPAYMAQKPIFIQDMLKVVKG